jgi:5-formyltetrahydrofolate cyclo-ligase
MGKKENIRKEITRRLKGQDPSEREERSREIQDKLLSSEEFRASKTVMTYVSMPTEVDTRYFIEEALKHGKRVAAPYIEPGNNKIIASLLTRIECLEKGPFGIYQPKEGPNREVLLKEIDLVVVPAIAYSTDNVRLGRGRGFYDRFLSSPDLAGAVTIGLAFSFQVLSLLPQDPHDRPVSKVITD